MTPEPVLEIGGSHLTAALVDASSWSIVPGSIHRRRLDPHASAARLIDAFADCVGELGPLTGHHLRVAIPGPFDYATGIGRFEGVAKFDALDGVDVGAVLRRALPEPPSAISFVNDAAAFTIGEWLAGAARGSRHVVGATLGTGVGSAFLAGGVVVDSGPQVPEQGRADLLTIGGRPLEATVSTRAIIASAGQGATGVIDVVDRAHAGDPVARSALHHALFELGRALAPWLVRFAADVCVVGGSIANAWDLIAPPLRDGLRGGGCSAGLVVAEHPATAALIGAAWKSERVAGDRGTAIPFAGMDDCDTVAG